MLKQKGLSALRVCAEPSTTLGNPRPAADWARGCPVVVDGAADVEALVRWAVRDQAAVAAVGGRTGPDGYLSFGRMVDTVARYGAAIQWGAAGACDRDPHPLAVEVMRWVGGDDAGVLVATHALCETRPDWMPGAVPKWQPVRWKKEGRLAQSEIDWIGRRPLYTKVTMTPDPKVVWRARSDWLDWWDRLDSVAEFVTGATGLQVRRLALARSPWEGDALDLTLRRKLDIPS